MKLLSLQTENFKQLGNYSVRFTDGTNIIVGENGTGKTTLVTAILFALFGTSSVAASADRIPTWGQKNCKVTLEVDRFTVARTLRDCTVTSADKVLAQGTSPCNAWIKSNLAMDSKMFQVFCMSQQGETSAVVTLGTTELNRVVEEYSGVGVIDKVIKSVRAECSGMESSILGKEFHDVQKFRDALVQLELNRKSCLLLKLAVESELETATDEVEKAAESVNERVQQLADIDETATKRAQLQGVAQARLEQLQQCTYDLEANAKEVEDARKVLADLGEDDSESVQASLKAYAAADLKHTSLTTQLAQLEKSYDNACEAIEDRSKIMDELQSVEKLFEESSAELESVRSLQSAAFSHMKEVKSEYQELVRHSEGDICRSCNRSLTQVEIDKALENLPECEKRLDAATENKQDLDFQLDNLKTQVLNLSRRINRLNKELPAQPETSLSELVELREGVQKAVTDIELKYQCFDSDSLTSRLESLSGAKDLISLTVKVHSEAEQKLSHSQSTYDKATKELDALPILGEVDRGVLKEDSAILEKMRGLVKTLQQRLSEAKEGVARVDRHTENAQQSLDRESKENDHLLMTKKDIKVRKELVKYLTKSRSKYLESVWSMILSVSSNFIESATSGWDSAITSVGRSESGDFTFTEGGVVQIAKSESSGAQKEFIGTAIRIGLSACLNPENPLLILDEPTAGMSEVNADRLATALLTTPGQKFIVTHRVSERLTAGNVIEL